MSMKILITGGAGFIGSALIRFLIKNTDHVVLNVDKLTYAANLDALKEVEDNSKYRFLKADICDEKAMEKAFNDFQPDAVMHLAAESHVDRSIAVSSEFIETNINGTHVLLSVARAYWESRDKFDHFKFIHVSTDEVYGSLMPEAPKFTEKTPYAPNSPYSASKAASDHLVRAWYETYGFPAIITHCSNNYGPYQNPEKLIPLIITSALKGDKLPVYGKGENIRDWIYVEDHVRGLVEILLKGRGGEVYNMMGGENEIRNIDVVNKMCDILDEISFRGDGKSYKEQIAFVEDRLGHDLRYAVDNNKINKGLSWSPKVTFEEGLLKTIKWYMGQRQ